MNIKKLITVGLAVTVAMLQWVAGAEIKVSDIEVFSGYPWKEVAIGYTITGTSSEPRALALEVSDKETGEKYEGVFSSLSLARSLDMSEGRHASRWLIRTGNRSFKSRNAVFTLKVVPGKNIYCIIDLAEGKEAVHYPVWYCYRDDKGFWADEYKTSKLALRYVAPCTFMMSGQYEVTLTKPYFMGVFAVTQKQYELVLGIKAQNEMRPVSGGLAAWGEFRGGDWPDKSRLPDLDSFVGKLRLRTGLNFDLPTEAQWECACRAGTTTDFSFGEELPDAYMWYGNNCIRGDSEHYALEPYLHDVGTRLSNPWGLYDMHGNIWEFCLDRFGDLKAGIDPEGTLDHYRVMRGGCFTRNADVCNSSSRVCVLGWSEINSRYVDCVGFRLARTVQANEL